MTRILAASLLFAALVIGTPVHGQASGAMRVYEVPPTPQYPTASRRDGEEGTVLIAVFVNADGSVGARQVRRSSGYPRLDAAALDAFAPVRFSVAPTPGGDAIRGWVAVPIAFKLEDPPAAPEAVPSAPAGTR